MCFHLPSRQYTKCTPALTPQTKNKKKSSMRAKHREKQTDLKVTMHFEACFIFMCPASDYYKILVSFICVLETGNVTLLATSSVFPEHR